MTASVTDAAAGLPGHAAPDRVLRYGPHDDQWVELWNPDARTPGGAPSSVGAAGLPGAPGSPGTVVLIHGGYWRAPYTAELMRPLVPQFTARGWTVANIEYRRGADGWAALRDDLSAALVAIRSDRPGQWLS